MSSYGGRHTPVTVELKPGDQIGKYTLDKFLEKGGQGAVFRARQGNSGRLVAIKLLPPELKASPHLQEQFQKSFDLIHTLQHEHIVPVHDFDVDPQHGPYLVMKLVENAVTLGVFRHQSVGGVLPLGIALEVLKPVASALDYAHQKKILHRDVKPENILLQVDARRRIIDIQLIDLGLVATLRTTLSGKMSDSSDQAGTRQYMSPEQWLGRKLDRRTDQYALGVVAYELLTGELPFDAHDFAILKEAVLHDPPPRLPAQAASMQWIFDKVLAKSAEDRFESCGEFVAALEKVLRGLPSDGRGPEKSFHSDSGSVPIDRRAKLPPKRTTHMPPRPLDAGRDTVRSGPMFVTEQPEKKRRTEPGIVVPPPADIGRTTASLSVGTRSPTGAAYSLTKSELLWPVFVTEYASYVMSIVLWVTVLANYDGYGEPNFIASMAGLGYFMCLMAGVLSTLMFIGIAWSSLPREKDDPSTAVVVSMHLIPVFNFFWWFWILYRQVKRVNSALDKCYEKQAAVPMLLVWLQLIPFVSIVASLMYRIRLLKAFRVLREWAPAIY